MKEELKFALTLTGAQCVATLLIRMMPQLPVVNLDTLSSVSYDSVLCLIENCPCVLFNRCSSLQ